MTLDASYTLLFACLALLIGMIVVKISPFLQKNHIPDAVVGGFIVAIVLLIVDKAAGYTFSFDTSLQSTLMIAFFSSIGLSSDFSRLIKGGKPLVILTLAVTILIVIQNAVGMGMAVMLNESPFIGLIAGSITLTGGHGNAGAWGPILADKYGVTGAVELAMACATMGLVLGGLVGGPVARHLLKKVTIPKATEQEKETILEAFEQPAVKRKINANNIIETISMLIICIVAGSYISELVKDTPMHLPTFVWCLFVGIIIRNVLTHVFKHEVFEPTVDVLGSVALSLFLAIALMSLKFGQLASMAGPVLIIIAVQTVVMVLFACFVTFKMMGSDYDAVVISAGHCGFGMGATPTAIANMQTITRAFSPSHKAFLVVPMVGAFLVDITNSIIIKLYIELGAAIA
ncbi:sodium/glutamate symporter [Providencia sp. JGM181]|uniref:Sodium/glutamate symporter n=1 Tax=Providencia alcalifaciens TaxID=126385 RepID=A0A4R3NG15_9GAMM|nr:MULTISPECIES: sodium/glutamate symporter [Providencia]MBS0923619.1 sodium/glutamate symporter [Providencia sp. JGM181]MBS0934787.1 sodium/glutamate symporter [Providencia sp. JGM172]MBS0998926.1 sodium/glutamate symporter [Providencia sp. JGM178]TCT31666.1 ESS family glutamate:Na+ symporter [Providencia alcalifaciens]